MVDNDHTTHTKRLSMNEYQRKWYQKNRQKCLERNKIWKQNNRDKARANGRRYYYRNRDAIRKKDNLKARQRCALRKKNGAPMRLSYNRNNRLKLLAIIGNDCIRCGFSDYRALEIDHVYSDGTIDRLKYKRNEQLFAYYIKHPDVAKKRLQVLCANCNRIKRVEMKEGRNQFGVF